MERSSELFRVSGELDYLVAAARPGVSPHRSPRELNPWSSTTSALSGLSGAASRRLIKLARAESEIHAPAVAHPVWLGGRAIPRLIVSASYDGLDAYGVSHMLARLDLATRRAGAMHRHLLNDGDGKEWPAPLRTHRGGLRLLDARVGSFDAVMTVWGALVTLATSSPVAVGGLIALAWDVGRGTVHLANRWRGAALTTGENKKPSLDLPTTSEPWGIQHTRALAPVLSQVVANDQGFEFYLADGEQRLKITVPPKAQTEDDDA